MKIKTFNTRLKYELVEFMPKVLSEGVIYISEPYSTAVHLCCCGCGLRVITPLTSKDWNVSFEGELVSLFPSVGNWSFPCKSHYWIRNGKVVVAEKWSNRKIELARTGNKFQGRKDDWSFESLLQKVKKWVCKRSL